MHTKTGNLEAVIFDLDGVIVDTAKYHYEAWKQLADSEGTYFDKKINERLKGVSRMVSLSIIMERKCREYTLDELNRMAEKKNGIYVKMLEELSDNEILPNIKEFICKLRDNGIKTAICSASKNTGLIMEKLGIASLFDVIVTGNDTTMTKPHPQGFLLAAERLRVHSCNCVIIEDAYAGIQAAVSAGMKSIGIGDPNQLDIADCVLPNTGELSLEKVHLLF